MEGSERDRDALLESLAVIQSAHWYQAVDRRDADSAHVVMRAIELQARLYGFLG